MNILDVKFFATSSNVAILIEVALLLSIDRSHYSITPKVELPSMNEQRIVNVPLDDESLILVVTRRIEN